MEFELLAKAVSSIPHVGQILAVAITVAVAIYEELNNLDSSLTAERELGEEASYIIRDVALYSQNLKASDPVHLERLAKQVAKVEEVAKRIRNHIWDTSSARQRHIRKYGRTLADIYDCTIETSVVLTLREHLKETRLQLMEEFQWIRMFEGDRSDVQEKAEKAYVLPMDMEFRYEPPEPTVSELVRWVKRAQLELNPNLCKKMVRVCPKEASEDGALWYVSRVSYIGGRQPAKYKPGDGAYFGFKREAIPSLNLDFEVLLAEPDTVRWEPMSGRFSEERLRPAQPVKGCYENDGTDLVIARAWAREHMHTGIFTEKTLQLGKASPKLSYAYVTAGKKEKKVEDYEVLVFV